jgi:NADH dehydrogenase (ubiquinone) 1 alpha subcomplex subunit 6
MVINPTYLAQRTRQCGSLPADAYEIGRTDVPAAVNWADAKRRVLKSYREWIRAVRCLLPFERPIILSV